MKINISRILRPCVAVLVCLNTGFAQAATFSQILGFSTSDQSIWGPGGSTVGFDFSDSVSFDIPLGLGSASVGYSIGASSGTVSAGFDGTMSVDYTGSLTAPGTTSLSLGYQGKPFSIGCQQPQGLICIPTLNPPGGTLSSSLGAHAQLTSSVGNVGPDVTLETDAIFTPVLGNAVNNSDSITAIQLPVIDVFVAAAGVQMGVTQDISFTANAIEGSLVYSLQGSGATNSMPFSLSNSGTNLAVDLTQSGIWDFWFVDQTLANAFSTSFNLDLGVFASTEVGCGFLALESCETSKNLISPNVFNVDPFALAFNNISNMNGFSIEVGSNGGPVSSLPEPSTLAMLGIGLIGLGFVRGKPKT